MVEVLFARTFIIVGAMLCLTAITAKYNKYFETTYEGVATIIISFLLFFLIYGYSNTYPLNLFLTAAFALAMGWMIGPTIEMIGLNFKITKYLREKGEPLEKDQRPTPDQVAEFRKATNFDAYHKQWQNIIFQAMAGTASAVLACALLAFLSDIDFSFLEQFLFVGLLTLIIMGTLNLIFFRSRVLRLAQAYAGAMIFTLYLIFDFHQLKTRAGDDSWSAAIDIAVQIYINIINLFIELLIAMAESQ